MLKFSVGIICYYILYCLYYVYQNVRTPVYDYTKGGEKGTKGQENVNLDQKYIFKPFKNFLKKNDKIDYHLYMSCEENIDLNQYENEKEKYLKKNKNFINVHKFTNISYDWNYNHVNEQNKWWSFFTKNKYPSVNLTIPRRLIKMNKNIYLHIITYVNDELYRHGSLTSLITKRRRMKSKSTHNEKYVWEHVFGEEEYDNDYDEERSEDGGEDVDEDGGQDGGEDSDEDGDENDEVDSYEKEEDEEDAADEENRTNKENEEGHNKSSKRNENEDEEEEEEEEEETEVDEEKNNKITEGTQEGRKKAHKKKVKVKKIKRKNYYIPKKLKFGPIVEYNDININKIGFFSNIFLDKSRSEYLLPTYFNNHLTPEDEYELLLNGMEEENGNEWYERKKKKKKFHQNTSKSINMNNSKYENENEIEIEYSPISYPHFNLFNIIIFNINYVKDKYKITSYDLDSVVIHLCGNIYTCLIICILCLIHLIIDLIALLFDITSWNKLNNLYSFSTNAIHLKFLFNLFIFLYLKNKNKCKIIMIFCAAKIAICLWKLLDHYDVEILEDYPYVHITCNSTNDETINDCNNNEDKGNKASGNKKYSIVEDIERNFKLKIVNVMIGTVIAICIYNFMFIQYDSLFSFIIHTVGICSYIFNFLFMCPQIVRNYCTKTVQHTPVFFFFFLFLYALMDDLFVLILRMPDVHKWNAFGDDIIFLIFLVQYCLYKKVDFKVIPADKAVTSHQGSKSSRESKKKK
ncbi:hypothetical protein, conserved [Plasmodium gonderi]|uniref:Serpentine receptor n=1 Tax=Plasmodium gonderi TaxID=77519 RepID=A0A1Y1JHF5_PLAGO|nr:hypothetical protein, conserved [Plasmodium gonderi]GAW81078.1 hypothetical protein, conserved [Plasmodium gonderi]